MTKNFDIYCRWATSLASDDVVVAINRDCYDADYGTYSCIGIQPRSLFLPQVEISFVDDAIGFTIESWDRLSLRLNGLVTAPLGIERNQGLVGAYCEPGLLTPGRTAQVIDAISSGALKVLVQVHRKELVGSKAQVGRQSYEEFPGPSKGASLLKIFGSNQTTELSYEGWPGATQDIAFFAS